MDTFNLPPAIITLVEARNSVRRHYTDVLRGQGSEAVLKFTLDGNLVGDIGEALAAELFGVRLSEKKSTEGFDGYTLDGRTVQVKATGTRGGPAFRKTKTGADHLLFFCLDFESATGVVAYNGPEHHVTRCLPPNHLTQRMVTRPQIRAANSMVHPEDRLLRLSDSGKVMDVLDKHTGVMGPRAH